jgi:hypothetical protein
VSPHALARVAAAALVLVLGATVLGTAALTETPPAPPEGSAAADAAAAAPQLDLNRLEAAAATVRELPFRAPVEKLFVSRDEVLPLLAEQVDNGLREAGSAAEQRLLAELELLPFEYPLRTKLLALLEEQVAGFYDPRARRLVVVDGMDEQFAGMAQLMLPAIYGHELLHALADQHFDFRRLIQQPADDGWDDVVMARRALAEGDATLGMLIMMFRLQGLEVTPEALPTGEGLRAMVRTTIAFPELEQAPPFLKAQLIEPYLLGLDVVGDAWRSGGWKAVDALWADPPDSTEQLLHPQRRGDEPTIVEPPPLPDGTLVVTLMQLGELGLRQWLEPRIGPDRARIAADGWDGDMVRLVRDADGRERIEIFTTWDTDADADEFVVAADTWLRKAKQEEAEGRNAWSLRQSGREVALRMLTGAARDPQVWVEPPPVPEDPVIDIGPEPEFPEFR